MVSLAQHDSALTSPGEVVAPVPRAESGTTRRWRPASWAAMAFPVALAGLVLFLVRANLAPSSLYQDDAWQALATRVHGWDQILRAGVTAPGYALALRGYADLAGHTTLALQLPALTAALALPALTYHLAQRTGLHPLTSALAATLIATSTTTLTYATRVKPYTLDACITIALLLASHRTLTRPSARRWTTLTATGLAALAFSASTVPVTLTALAVPLAASAHHAYRTHRARTLLLPATATTTYLATLTTYQHLLPAAHLPTLTRFWVDQGFLPGRGNGLHRVPALLSGLIGQFLPITTAGAAHTEAVTVVGALLVSGVLATAWRRQWALLGWLGLPPAIALGLALTGHVPFGDGRTDLYLYPCLALLAVRGLDAAVRQRALLEAAGFGLTATMVLVAVPACAVSPQPPYPAQGSPALQSRILGGLGPHDGVIVLPGPGYTWALDSSPAPRLVANPLSMTGFTPQLPDPRQLFIGDFVGQSDGGLLYRQAIEQARTQIRRLIAWVGAHGGQSIWVVAISAEQISPTIPGILRASGYHLAQKIDVPTAGAVRWVRTG
jgi:hypothetical protein